MPPVLEEYEVSEVLLRESTGIIYAGKFKKSGYAVAVEEIASDLRTTPGFIAQLADAGKRAADLRHPCAVAVHNLLEEGETLCLITEMIDGRPLRTLAPRGAPLPPESALSIVDDVLSAIEEAHRVGVVHGDVGPESITIGREGTAKLGGFAVAYAVATTPGAPAWRRPAYAPNRAPGGGADEAGDIYACAALAHELLTGAPPGEAEVTVPEAMAAPLARALATDPHDRFLSASSLRIAIGDAAVKAYGTAWRAGADLAERFDGRVAPPPSRVALPASPIIHASGDETGATADADTAGTASRADAVSTPGGDTGTNRGTDTMSNTGTDAASSTRIGAVSATGVATPTADGASTATPSAETPGPAAGTPHPRDPAGQSRRNRLVLIAAAVVIAAIIAAAVLVAAPAGITNSGPLGVNNDVQLTVTPQNGGCNTTFQFVATGTLHGTGTLVYRFDQSDGRGSRDISLPITPAEGSFRLTRLWRLQDSVTEQESMTFRILQPSAHTAKRTVSYSCA